MIPRIETLKVTRLTGRKLIMSLAHNRTRELWQSFMPGVKTITNRIGTELYSVELYHDPVFFRTFDPIKEFDKWAAVRVSDHDYIPYEMEPLVIPEGLYAVFHYKGKPSDAQKIYQYIYSEWTPASGYELDNRPHFARMGEKYKGEHPDSEEELWIPISKK